MRNKLGIGVDVFAGSADASQRVKFGTEDGDEYIYGWTSEYSTPGSEKYPSRKNFNHLFATFTAAVSDINKFGSMLPWDANISYEKKAVVMGSDGIVHVSRASGNLGNNPTMLDATHWIIQYGVVVVSEIPSIPVSGVMYVLTQEDPYKSVPKGMYTYDGLSLHCLSQEAEYSFDSGSGINFPFVGGLIYNINITENVTSWNAGIVGGSCTILLSNPLGYSVAEPSSGFKRTIDGLRFIDSPFVEIVATGSPAGTIYSSVELVAI